MVLMPREITTDTMFALMMLMEKYRDDVVIRSKSRELVKQNLARQNTCV